VRYFVHIGYNGLNYRGWQRQSRVLTVQEVMETSISRVFGKSITCIGCGRTDAMVHAAQYFFHFDIDLNWTFNLLLRLNKVLPDDIAVFDIIPVEGKPHAQFDAIMRTYEYFIHTHKDPFLHGLSALYEEPNLNLEHMMQAAYLLPKYTDFSLFCKSPEKNDCNICDVYSAKLYVNDQADRLRFQISSNRFIKGMIRIIVKRLLDIGKGILTVEEFEGILQGRIKPKEITIAYPQGLYLVKVKYPFLDLPTSPDFFGVASNHDFYWKEVTHSKD